MTTSHRLSLVGAALLLLPLTCSLAACVTTTTRVDSSPWVQPGAVDPDALRLQKIAGALLLYFQRYRHLPGTLADLAVNRPQHPLKFTNPATGKPYVYAPTPLPGNPVKVWLLAYDAAPVHGRRWVILAQPPESGRPASMWVAKLDETAFQRFHPAASRATGSGGS